MSWRPRAPTKSRTALLLYSLPRLAVPDHGLRAAQMPHQALRKLDDLRRLDRARKEFEVEVPPCDNPDHDRKRLPVEAELEHPASGPCHPGAHAAMRLAQSAFVDQDDQLSLSLGVLSSCQSTRFQWRIGASLRSSARYGMCGCRGVFPKYALILLYYVILATIEE